MQRLGDIMPQVLAKFRHNNAFKHEAIAWYWREIVGDEVARHARPVRVLRGGLLLLATDSAVWAHHLSMLSHELLHKVNARLPSLGLKSLRFQAGYWPADTNENNGAGKESAQPVAAVPLTPEEQHRAVMLAAPADDPALRRTVADVIRQYYRWRKQRLQDKWHPCASCQALCPPEEKLCTACHREQRRSRDEALRRLLLDMPWASYQQAAPFVSCSALVYKRTKRRLMEELWLRLATRRSLSPQRDAAALTMLKTGLEPRDITPDIMQQTLGYNICKILAGRHRTDVFTRGRGHGGGDEGHHRHR